MKYVPMVRVQLVREGTITSQTPLTSPGEVNAFIKPHLEDKDREYMVAILLDTRNRVLAVQDVAIGTLDTTPIAPREVFKAAILVGAASIILAHNHPSGDSSPSSNDIQVTGCLMKAGELLGIKVLDHIIVGDSFFSLKDKGYMDNRTS